MLFKIRKINIINKIRPWFKNQKITYLVSSIPSLSETLSVLPDVLVIGFLGVFVGTIVVGYAITCYMGKEEAIKYLLEVNRKMEAFQKEKENANVIVTNASEVTTENVNVIEPNVPSRLTTEKIQAYIKYFTTEHSNVSDILKVYHKNNQKLDLLGFFEDDKYNNLKAICGETQSGLYPITNPAVLLEIQDFFKAQKTALIAAGHEDKFCEINRIIDARVSYLNNNYNPIRVQEALKTISDAQKKNLNTNENVYSYSDIEIDALLDSDDLLSQVKAFHDLAISNRVLSNQQKIDLGCWYEDSQDNFAALCSKIDPEILHNMVNVILQYIS